MFVLSAACLMKMAAADLCEGDEWPNPDGPTSMDVMQDFHAVVEIFGYMMHVLQNGTYDDKFEPTVTARIGRAGPT